MGSPYGAEAWYGAVLWILVGVVLQLAGLACDGRAVVEQDGDVDAHDGHDAAHVEVHHEDSL